MAADRSETLHENRFSGRTACGLNLGNTQYT
jgi:hypothetical protein